MDDVGGYDDNDDDGDNYDDIDDDCDNDDIVGNDTVIITIIKYFYGL